jgi:hypothetical protein
LLAGSACFVGWVERERTRERKRRLALRREGRWACVCTCSCVCVCLCVCRERDGVRSLSLAPARKILHPSLVLLPSERQTQCAREKERARERMCVRERKRENISFKRSLMLIPCLPYLTGQKSKQQHTACPGSAACGAPEKAQIVMLLHVCVLCASLSVSPSPLPLQPEVTDRGDLKTQRGRKQKPRTCCCCRCSCRNTAALSHPPASCVPFGDLCAAARMPLLSTSTALPAFSAV